MTAKQNKEITFREVPSFYPFKYSNYDLAADYSDRKSILKFVFTLSGWFISNNLKKQPFIKLLSTEAENIAFCLIK